MPLLALLLACVVADTRVGSILGIAAAIWGENSVVELLCCIPLYVHGTQLRMGKRMITALRVALKTLFENYA
ncbi:hypothetical protein C8Q70DRAFT_1123530, partial [Cubamyces menziesii]